MTQSANTQRVQRRRDKLRSRGMRPIQIWVADTAAPGFREEAARQARLVAAATAQDDLDLLDRLAEDVFADQ